MSCRWGGGGLISGIAAAVKAADPNIQVVGAQTAACPAAYQAIQSGAVTKVKSEATIADGIHVRAVGAQPLKIMQQCVDRIALADEDEIAAAILLLLERKKILAEGAGAVSLAAVLNKKITVPRDGKTVLIVSGGNVDTPLLDRIIRKGLVENGRIMRLRVNLEDRPGALAGLLARIAGKKANVLNIRHDRNVRTTSLYLSRVRLEIETRNMAHAEEISAALDACGYTVEWE